MSCLPGNIVAFTTWQEPGCNELLFLVVASIGRNKYVLFYDGMAWPDQEDVEYLRDINELLKEH